MNSQPPVLFQPTPQQKQEERLGILLIVSVLLTIALYVIPGGSKLGYPLMLLSTFAHEMGHGIAAIMVGGEFKSFTMHADGSGVATLLLPRKSMASAVSSAGGLLGPPLVAAVLLALATRQKWAGAILWVLAAVSVISVVWVVRSWFGAFFIVGFAALVAAAAHWGKPLVQQFVLIFLATQLGMSVFSRGDYLFTAYADTARGRGPSDVQQIADALFGPFWLWGGLIALLSGGILFVALRFYAIEWLRHYDQVGDRKRLR